MLKLLMQDRPPQHQRAQAPLPRHSLAHCLVGCPLLLLIAGLAQAAEPFSLVSVLTDPQAFDRPHDIELQGDLAFVPGKGGSLAVVDVSDLKRPRLVWSRHDGQHFQDAQTVLPAGRELYVGSRDFYALDIRQPAKTKILQRIADRPRIDAMNGMVRRGDYLLSANKTGWIALFDIRQPREPKYDGALDTRKQGGIRSPHDIALAGDYVAIVDQSQAAPHKLRLYQVADLVTHQLLPCNQWKPAGAVESADLNGANRVAIARGHAFVACSKQENFTIGFIDIRDPNRPRHLKTLPFAGIHPTGLTIAGNVLFVGGGQTIQAIDIRNPGEPQTLAQYKSTAVFPTGRDNIHDLVYRDGCLFVTAQNDHRIVILQVNDAKILELAGE